MELLPFGSVDRCPKCGGTAQTRKYKGPYRMSFDDDLPERLDVTCVECGYVWCEQCADAGEKARTDAGATQKFNAA
jgi:hypothetical protein